MELLSLKKYIQPKHLLFITIVFGLFFFSLDSVFAATPPAGSSPAPTTSTESVQKVITAVHTAMQIMGALLGVITALVTMLMHPGWYNGEAFNMQVYFHQIWVLVSNVVYFIFAFLLIWVAFMNIIGKGEGGNYELKKALPKIIVGILMVPLSWFIVQFVVSLSSVLMVAILSLPFDTFKDKPIFQGNTTKVCTKFVLDLGGAPTTGGAAAGAGGATTPTKYFECANEDELNNILKAEDSVYGIVGMYTYGILQLDKLNEATITSLQGAKTLTGVVLKAMFDAVFILVYIILMVAIFIALFMRGVYIWMFMMLSPLFGLFYFLDDKGDNALGALKKFNITEFVKIALIPVWVGAALSFGILFLFITTKGLNESADKKETGSTFIECSTENGGKSCTITAGKFAFQVKGSAGSTLSALNDGKEFTSSALGAILINFFGLAVLWMAVMAALKGSELSGTAIAPIESFGKSIGETALKAPQYLPILPGGLSASGLGKLGSTVSNIPEQLTANATKPWEQKLNTTFGLNNMTSSQQQEIKTKISAASTKSEFKGLQTDIQNAIKEYSTKDKKVQELLGDFAVKMAPKWGLKPEDVALDKLFSADGTITELGYKVLTTDVTRSSLRGDTLGYVDYKTRAKEKGTSVPDPNNQSQSANPIQGVTKTVDGGNTTMNLGGNKIYFNATGDIVSQDGKQISDKTETYKAIARAIANESTIGAMKQADLEKWVKDNFITADQAAIQKAITDAIKGLPNNGTTFFAS